MKPSKRDLKFLFIFFFINLFAVLTNVFRIDISFETGGERAEGYTYGTYTIGDKYKTYIFTNSTFRDKSTWPFVNYFEEEVFPSEFDSFTNHYIDHGAYQKISRLHIFNGVFYQYSMQSFMLMMLFGILIIFTPKVWRIINK